MKKTITLLLSLLVIAAMTVTVWAGKPTKTTVYDANFGFWEASCAWMGGEEYDFLVQHRFDVRITDTIFYDKDGNPTKIRSHWLGTDYLSRVSDPTKFLSGNAVANITTDLVNGVKTVTGATWNIHVAGYSKVLHESGRSYGYYDPELDEWVWTFTGLLEMHWDIVCMLLK